MSHIYREYQCAALEYYLTKFRLAVRTQLYVINSKDKFLVYEISYDSHMLYASCFPQIAINNLTEIWHTPVMRGLNTCAYSTIKKIGTKNT